MANKKSAWVGRSASGKLLFDFDLLDEHTPKKAWNAFKAKKEKPFVRQKNDAGYNAPRSHRKYQSPEALQEAVNGYFMSCLGPMLNKYGDILYDRKTGDMLMIKARPYTRTGLRLFLGLSETIFYRYIGGNIAGRHDDSRFEEGEGEDPAYSRVMKDAIAKIDAQAEEYLYDRDAGRGAEFYLKCKNAWQSPKENAETRKIQEQILLLREEFELKKKVLLGDNDDTELVVQIVRKKKEEDDE